MKNNQTPLTTDMNIINPDSQALAAGFRQPKTFYSVACAAGLLMAGVLTASAANYYLTASDGANTSSFNSAGHWNAGGAPAPGNTYQITNTAVNGVFMRTPASGNTIFQGDSLTIGLGGTVLGKISGTGSITVTNFILDGGWLHEYDTASSSSTLIVAGNVNVMADSCIGGVSTGNNASFGNILEFTAPISGSAALSVSGPFNNGGDMGTVRLRGANPYSGTMTVSNGLSGTTAAICSAVNRILQLANVDAVSNATLNLVSVVTNPVSFLAASNTAAFNVGALAGSANQALADTAGAAVAVSIGGNGASTTYGGILSGAGSLTKIGSGTLTLSNANSFTGNTIINAGTLKLSNGGRLASGNVTVAAGATLDVAGQTAPALAANQNLNGAGTVNGSLTTSATSKIYPGTDGTVGTLAFNNNLTNVTGSVFNLDVGTSAGSGNDAVTVGGTLALNGTTLNIQALGGAANLDTSADYILITAASIVGTPNATVVWVGTQPANAGYFTVVSSGTQVRLHYAAGTPLTATGAANPSMVTRNQSTLLTIAVTPATVPLSTGITVTANLAPIGGSATQTFYDDGTHGDITAGDGVYSFSVAVPANIAVGSMTINGTVTDAQGRIATPAFPLTVQAGSLTWNGGGADNNWSSNPNWAGGFAPGYAGDTLTFAGTTRLTPIMDANYSVIGVAFDGTAGSFVIGTSGNSLTLTGSGVENDSGNTEALNVPVTTAAPAVFNAAAGNLTLGAITNAGNLVSVAGGANTIVNGGISGTGGLDQGGSGSLVLTGTNTYNGSTSIDSGNLQIAGAGLLGGGSYVGNITNNATFEYSSSATQIVSGVISGTGNVIVDGPGTLTLDGTNSYNGDTTINGGVLQLAGAGVLRASYAGNITDNGVFQYSSTAAQTLTGVISGSGSVVKDGPGTLTLDGANNYGGATVVIAGNLIYDPDLGGYPSVNALAVSNATVTVNAGTGSSLLVGSLTLNNHATLALNYDFSAGNPGAPAINVQTSLAVVGTNITIDVGGVGPTLGQFPLIGYAGSPLPNLANFTLAGVPPGVTASLVNNQTAGSIDLLVSSEIATTWVPLIGNDGFGNSSFNSAGLWADGNPPTSGVGYYTGSYVLRSPADANNYAFGGTALSIDTGARFLLKGNGGQVLTIDNLYLNGGVMDFANTANDNYTETVAGSITLQSNLTSYLGALGGAGVDETFYISADISGGGNLQIGGSSVNGGQDVGTVVLSGANTYTGNTTVAGGTLLVNGSLGSTAITVGANASLGGSGTIAGPVTVQQGGKLSPGTSQTGALTNAIGTLSVDSTVTLAGTVAMKINRATTANSDSLQAASIVVNSGATLTVNNIGSTNLLAGDSFKLFSVPVSGFATITLPALPGTNVVWTNELSINGTVAILSSVVINPNPTNITFAVTAGNLSLSWPLDRTGWTLQAQTNAPGLGLGTDWVDVPGSAATNLIHIPIDPANGAVFYRLNLK